MVDVKSEGQFVLLPMEVLICATGRVSMAFKQTLAKHWRKDEIAWAIGLLMCLFFTILVGALSGCLNSVLHPVDRGPTWYYWVLPEPTITTRLTVWVLYMSHQLLHLVSVYYGQHYYNNYSHSLRPLHYWMAGMNFVFVLLHILQSHITYDGLAQDLPLIPVLGFAGMALLWVLLMENNRRGLFFGYQIPFSENLIQFSRKYHPYYFSLAFVAVFWFHPMEGTWQHLSGLLYTLVFLLQSCLFFTPMHCKKYWTCSVEVMVIIHGSVVGFYEVNKTWSAYFFGFAMVFVVTQMHGLDLKFSSKAVIIILIVIGSVLLYLQRGGDFIKELYGIPALEYAGVFVLAGVLWCLMKVL